MSEVAMRMEKEKSSVDPAVQSAKRSVSRENRTGIPQRLKERMEQSTGVSFDDVRVHYNSALPARLDSLAYTQGNQVEIGPGQERHLPHELGHVVQQKLGIVRANARHASGVMLNTDSVLEHQADEIGAGKCVQLKAMQEQDSLTAQHDAGQDCEKVVQCRMNPNALVYDILQIILEEPDNLQGLLVVLRPGTDVKTIKESVDFYAEFLGSKLEDIYQLFFKHYGIDVTHMPKEIIMDNLQCEEGEFDFDKMFLQDESDLIDVLNDLYSIQTGQELLNRIADNKERNEKMGVKIELEPTRPEAVTESRGQYKDEFMQGNRNGGYKRGKGAGTIIALPTKGMVHLIAEFAELSKQDPEVYQSRLESYENFLKNDPRIVLAHELIHALHAQMGIKPTWEALLGSLNISSQTHQLSEAPPDQEFLERTGKKYLNATSDDVAVMGIDELQYPGPLSEVGHITENRIRTELKQPLRMMY